MNKRPRIGISACLPGERVRYDGESRYEPALIEALSHVFDFVPVCPEVAIGLGVPRPPVRLVGGIAQPYARGVENAQLDITAPLVEYAARMARELADIDGYVFKSRSPGCGLNSAPVYDGDGAPQAWGAGLFAREILTRHPSLPVAEEGGLRTARERDDFIARVRAYHSSKA